MTFTDEDIRRWASKNNYLYSVNIQRGLIVLPDDCENLAVGADKATARYPNTQVMLYTGAVPANIGSNCPDNSCSDFLGASPISQHSQLSDTRYRDHSLQSPPGLRLASDFHPNLGASSEGGFPRTTFDSSMAIRLPNTITRGGKNDGLENATNPDLEGGSTSTKKLEDTKSSTIEPARSASTPTCKDDRVDREVEAARTLQSGAAVDHSGHSSLTSPNQGQEGHLPVSNFVKERYSSYGSEFYE